MNKNLNKTYHESAIQHVTGEAVYVGDMDGSTQMLTGKVVFSPHAYAHIVDYDLSEALNVKGVHDILDFKRIPGHNQLNPIAMDEPCLADGAVNCIGQAVFLIAADDMASALEAEKKIKIQYQTLEPILTIDEAIKNDSRLINPRRIETGDPDTVLQNSENVLEGTLNSGAQEHWYLETQVALCVPGENREMTVYASSQSPTETQLAVAGVLNLPANQVVCEVKRMGGGFGGKELQGNHVAAWAALLADATRRPVKIQLSRDEDQKYTGKRHRFKSEYKVGFDEKGEIQACIVNMNADAGMATDLSIPVLERALFHAENAYYIPNMRITGNLWKTNLPSNTAFRGFGGPQGIAVIENIVDRIARFLKKDAADIRYKNFYGKNDRNETPYGQKVKNNHLFTIWDKLTGSGQYWKRRKEINSYNKNNKYTKRGIALTPVKFGISFTTSFLNQAGALVLIYRDGTVLVNHGGTEMGQGLHTKVWQIAALELGVSYDKVKVNATNTSKVPNTSPTAASSGSDLNGMAVKNAMTILKERLTPCARTMFEEKYNIAAGKNLIFNDGWVYDESHSDKKIAFNELVERAHKERISLSTTGYYKTPGIHFDREKGKGEPFYYFAYGMAISEAEIDILTGDAKILRTDIVHDVGDPINTNIDMGQIAGGFIQGMGWCTTETIKWGEKGELLNYSPSTYKIPSIEDIPKTFNVEILKNVPNPPVIRKSKAVGEPPFMLAFSAWLAIKDAISALNNHQSEPYFELPANNEMILHSIENLKNSF